MNGPWLVNGAVCDRVPADDRGLHYGQGLFETMRLSGGELPLWPRHRARVRGFLCAARCANLLRHAC